MGENGQQRRLSAILAADVAGYTRLVEQDTDGTVAAWRAARADIIDPAIATHSGRIVKHTGDGFLAEFTTVQQAVICAISMQERLANGSLDFRMGINLGDIIDDGEDIHGEGVNIAARLEGLAEPGGICISGDVYNQVRNRLDHRFEDLGEQEVKHVSAPVQVWRWVTNGAPLETDSEKLPEVSPDPASSDRPSIAVLPFDNMSNDPEQEYFSDGITEDIITELARYPDFLVIARNSTFVYKGKATNVRQVADDLGVRFLLEGSVRKAGNRIRIVAQLIDATSEGHLWAERFDRDLDDLFAVQDEITALIVSALGESIHAAHLRHTRRKKPSTMDAYDKCLQASAKIVELDRTLYSEARELAEEAIALDAGFAQAYAIVAVTHLVSFTSGWAVDPERELNSAYETVQRAVALDDHNYLAHTILGLCQTWQRRHDLAIASLERAVSLNPNNADTRAQFTNALVFAGQPEEALQQMEVAMRLNPHYSGRYLHFQGRAFFALRRYEEAEHVFAQAVSRSPGWPWAHLMLAAARVALGWNEAARADVAEALKLSSDLNLGDVPRLWPCRNQADLDHLLELLRLAGLSE